MELLVTADTRAALGGAFVTRRVCRARVVNIAQPVDIYELTASADGEFVGASEAALTALEQGRFAEAAHIAGDLLVRHPGDGPIHQLVLSRAAVAILDDGKGFDPVWTPPGK